MSDDPRMTAGQLISLIADQCEDLTKPILLKLPRHFVGGSPASWKKGMSANFNVVEHKTVIEDRDGFYLIDAEPEEKSDDD